MITVKKVILDVLKPHKPNGLEFASLLSEKCPESIINLRVSAVDENTESVVLEIEGDNLEYETILSAIQEMGGSVHSIDEVEVLNTSEPANTD